MGRIRRYKNIIERFLSGESGQRFFNFAYSIGAAVVIWGALFKILHLPGGNTLLCIGMGTEVIMFILTAFDRPPREYNWEEVFPVFDTHNAEDRPSDEELAAAAAAAGAAAAQGATAQGAVQGAGAVQGSAQGAVQGSVQGSAVVGTPVAGIQVPIAPAKKLEPIVITDDSDPADITHQYLSQMAAMSQQLEQLRETTAALNQVSEVLLESYRAITENSTNITQSSVGYVEQMQNLNRNISGLNTIYEIQLKSVSSQLDAIDNVNRGIKDIAKMYEDTANQSVRYCEESEKMAAHMQKLNEVYAKMLTAMTINMPNAGV